MPQPVPLPVKSRGVPSHLGKEESELFMSITRAYALHDEVSQKILEEACASLQRARLARETLAKEGLTFKDAKGRPKPHPCCAIERDARAAGLAALKQLNLELPRTVSKKSVW
jgi:Phage terminase, small subunit